MRVAILIGLYLVAQSITPLEEVISNGVGYVVVWCFIQDVYYMVIK